MGINIRIRFTGLCTFGPEVNDGKKFRSVMLVNARDIAEPRNPDKQPHVAAILAPFANFMETGRDFDIRFDGRKAGFGSDDMIGFLLKGEQLSLPDLAGEEVSLQPGPAPDAECPTTTNRHGFGWVSSLKRAEEVNPTNDAMTGKDKKLLLARLRVERGRLITEKFVEYKDKIVLWKNLSKASPEKERALAEVVTLTGISVAGEKWIIHSEAFVGGRTEIHFKGDAGKAHIWFVNMPLEDIVNPDRTPNDPPKADAHFHHYYHLATRGSRNPQPGSRLCDPLAQDSEMADASQIARDPGAAASNPKCPPSSFEV